MESTYSSSQVYHILWIFYEFSKKSTMTCVNKRKGWLMVFLWSNRSKNGSNTHPWTLQEHRSRMGFWKWTSFGAGIMPTKHVNHMLTNSKEGKALHIRAKSNSKRELTFLAMMKTKKQVHMNSSKSIKATTKLWCKKWIESRSELFKNYPVMPWVYYLFTSSLFSSLLWQFWFSFFILQ